jgi:tetratricopeptide (TPR) repeat protein
MTDATEVRLEPLRSLAAQALDTPFIPLPDSLTDLLRSLLETKTTAETRPLAGDDLLANGFRFDEIIGRGGMGTVYRAWDEALQRPVAVKVLRFVADQQQYEQFQREAQAAATLRSDYVVPIYSTGQTLDSRPYLVMPLIRGRTLRDLLQAGPIPAKQLANILREVAEGTQALHAAGLLHRDIKPANILIDEDDGRAKLTDFGLARTQASTGLTLDGVLAGTPEYMAPEQAIAKHPLDARTDVYSLGVTLFEGLTGSLPLEGTPFEILRKRCITEPFSPRQVNPTVPRDLATICLKAMAIDPARRYATAAALANDLDRWIKGLPISARPIGWIERSARWATRNPLAMGILLAVFCGAVASGLGWSQAVTNAKLADERRIAAEQSAIAEGEQRVRAEKHLETSRFAIDRFRSRITTPGFLTEPKYEGLRQELLTDATEVYERLLEIEAADDRFHRAAITTAHQLGLLQSSLGRVDDAEKTLRRSITFARTVMEQNPQDAEAKTLLLLSLNTLQVILAKANKPLLAAEVDDETIAISIDLLNLKPEDLNLRRNVASLQANRANKAIAQGDKATGRRYLLEARSQFEELIRLKPDDVTYKIDLTRIDMNLGLAHEKTPDRLKYFTAALFARRKLVNIEPRRPYFVNEYVKNCLVLSFELHTTNDWKPALEYALEGIPEARKQLSKGTDTQLQLLLFDLLNLQALCQVKLDKPAEAEAAFQDAIEHFASLQSKSESYNVGPGVETVLELLKLLKGQNRLHSAEAEAARATALGWLESARQRTQPASPERRNIGEWTKKLDDFK